MKRQKMTILLGEPLFVGGCVRWLIQQGSTYKVTWKSENGERSSVESKSLDDMHKVYSFQPVPDLRGEAVRVTEHLPSESREPSVVLDLLDRIRELESTISRVRDLHARVDVWNECAVCTEHAEALPYPCPTIQALGDQK